MEHVGCPPIPPVSTTAERRPEAGCGMTLGRHAGSLCSGCCSPSTIPLNDMRVSCGAAGGAGRRSRGLPGDGIPNGPIEPVVVSPELHLATIGVMEHHALNGLAHKECSQPVKTPGAFGNHIRTMQTQLVFRHVLVVCPDFGANSLICAVKQVLGPVQASRSNPDVFGTIRTNPVRPVSRDGIWIATGKSTTGRYSAVPTVEPSVELAAYNRARGAVPFSGGNAFPPRDPLTARRNQG